MYYYTIEVIDKSVFDHYYVIGINIDFKYITSIIISFLKS